MLASGWRLELWRRQSTEQARILQWLGEARQQGFSHYGLYQVGQCYWLSCTGEANVGDAVAHVHQQLTSTQDPSWVVLQVVGEQVWVIAWREQTLLCALAIDLEANPNSFLFELTATWLATDGMQCQLMLAGEMAQQRWLTAPWPVSPQVCDELFNQAPSKGQQLLNIRKPPPWLRRKVVVLSATISLCLALLLGWLLWPTTPSEAGLDSHPQAQQRPPMAGVQLASMAALPQQLLRWSYVAGWKVQQWQFSEQQQQLHVQQGYASMADLRQQLQPIWFYQLGAVAGSAQPGLLLTANVPSAWQQEPSLAKLAPSLAYLESSLSELQQWFPQAQFKVAAVQTDGWYQWQQVQVQVLGFDPLLWSSAGAKAWRQLPSELRLVAASAKADGLLWQLQLELRAYAHGGQAHGRDYD